MSNTAIPHPDVERDVRTPVAALWRRLPLILVFAGLIAAGTYAGLTHVAPVYLSETTILLEAGESDLTRTTGAGTASGALGREAIQSQVQLIRSRDLGKSVVARLQLASSPEFNPSAERGWFATMLAAIGILRPPADAPLEERVLNAYYDRLSVHAIDNSRVIAIGFSSEDPELAAAVANAVAGEYIALQRTARRDTTADAAAWLSTQIDDLRVTVREAEARVERYRNDHDLFASEGGSTPSTLSQQQLSDFNAELTRVRAARAVAEAKAAGIRAALAAGSAPNLADVLSSPLIQRLVEQQVTLRSEIAQLNATLLPQHPEMRARAAQLVDLDRQIEAETRKILAAAEGEARLAAARETELQQGLAGLKTTAASANDAGVELRALEREAAAQRDLLESYLTRYREALAREQAGSLPADARVVSKAPVPIDPNFPKVLPMTLAATVAALVLAVAFVLLREAAAGRSTRQIAFTAAIPAMPQRVPAAAPAPTPARWADDRAMRRMMPKEPTLVPEIVDRVEESLTAIAADIVASGEKRIVVTLAEDSDKAGRPLGAVALARSLARTDARVVLVDLRSDGANAESMGEAGNLPGFSDLLDGAASFAQVIFRDRRSRVHFIPAGRRPVTPKAIDTEQLETVLSALAMTYDYLLIDAADDMIAMVGPGSGAAMVVSEHPAGDPRTARAFDRIMAVSDARIMLLVVDPASEPEPGNSRRTPAGAAA